MGLNLSIRTKQTLRLIVEAITSDLSRTTTAIGDAVKFELNAIKYPRHPACKLESLPLFVKRVTSGGNPP
jgi:hypothetical protein